MGTVMTSRMGDCKVPGCTNSAVVGANGQDTCLEHFFSSCYEQLEKLESAALRLSLDPVEVQAARSLLEDYSNGTLFICFHDQSLTNLERSRLLEILLSCRDLQNRLTNRPSLCCEK
jgi:hypothetical protein